MAQTARDSWILLLTVVTCLLTPYAIIHFRAYWVFALGAAMNAVPPSWGAVSIIVLTGLNALGVLLPAAMLCVPFGWGVRTRPAIRGAVVGTFSAATLLYLLSGLPLPEELAPTWTRVVPSRFLVVQEAISATLLAGGCSLFAVWGARLGSKRWA